MTVYPSAIDDDRTIIRIDDDLSELGTAAINQLRSAVFAIEKELGITPSGSMSSVDSRISVSLNEDGTIKTTALQAAGLASLPIVDNQVATNAGIKEYKLDLDVNTLTLEAMINASNVIVNNTAAMAANTAADLTSHINGVSPLPSGGNGRHLDNQIDLSAILVDRNGAPRPATQVAQALFQINASLNAHENSITGAHPATAITVDSADWRSLPTDSADLQEVLDFLDNQETLTTGVDRATLNANGIPRNARVQRIDLDGYSYEVVPDTRVAAFLAEPSQTAPRDSITSGDDVISFKPESNSGYVFDSLFTQVRIGDVVRINYGSGVSGMFKVASIRFTPDEEWVIRIDGVNLVNRDGDIDGYAYARIDRSRHDINTYGVLAVAGVHADVFPSGGCATMCDGIVVGSPRGASVLGLGFDPGAFNTQHYNLWLRLYPSGDPSQFSDLPPIDVTGNGGTTPGTYSLDTIVETTNNIFRSAGYNYRFIAFQHDGEFGIMLADCINGASFSIVTGVANGTTIDEDMYVFNVVGDATDGLDPLGFGSARAVVASPVNSGFSSALEAANLSTIIHQPIRNRDFLVDGSRKDFLKDKDSQTDGYWVASVITNDDQPPNGTIATTYRINQALLPDELKPGKTIVIQPVDPNEISITGYGRFIIGAVSFNEALGYTDIMVINSCHGTIDPRGSVLPVGTSVLIYFSEDSIGLNVSHLASSGVYHRYHEVFVGPLGTTQTVERARISKQAGGTYLLNTEYLWQIRNVSPKMRGVRVNDAFRYWMRLYIINYDNTTGEFDGYIGELSSLSTPGIINPGPLTRGTKNHVVRFYDNTYVNFIDIEFREQTTNPGTIISAPPQYTNIEIFPALALDDEMMRIAGVSHNDTVVGSVTDLREFGTISEENFTDSAMSFIESGERYLHTNGVVRGFEYTGTGSSAVELKFTGGLGLVDGSFVATDALTCRIPLTRPTTSASVVFFICLTKDGTLKAIPENVGAQFFDNSSAQLVESFSFIDIVDNHKEFLILYVATINVTSVTLTSVLDARRFAYNGDTNGFSLETVSSGSVAPVNASFHSFDALSTWVNRYGVSEVEIKNVSINSAISFSATKVVRLYGGQITIGSSGSLAMQNVVLDNSMVIVNRVVGLIIEYCTIRNCRLIWNVPTISYTAGDTINAASGGLITIVTTGCVIENNFFFCNTGPQRPPFIKNYTSTGPITYYNIRISGNQFSDAFATNNCAVCFYHSSNTAYLTDVFVRDNKCGSNNIFIGGSALIWPGWFTTNVHVSGNECGVIGYGNRANLGNSRLNIEGNNCIMIASSKGTRDGLGNIGTTIYYGSGNVTIRNNEVQGMMFLGMAGNGMPSSVEVSNNNVYLFGSSIINGWTNSTVPLSGIVVLDYSTTSNNSKYTSSLISGNKVYCVDIGTFGSITIGGITTTGYATIIDNIVDIKTTYIASFVGITSSVTAGYAGNVNIRGNSLYRNGYTISNYISCPENSSLFSGTIVDNYLDSPFITGVTGFANAIYTAPYASFVVLRNKNHQVQEYFNAGRSDYLIIRVAPADSDMAVVNLNDVPNVDADGTHHGHEASTTLFEVGIDSGDTVDFYIYLRLQSMLPDGVSMISAGCDASVNDIDDWTTSALTFQPQRNGVDVGVADVFDPRSVTTQALSCDFGYLPVRGTQLQIHYDLHRAATPSTTILLDNFNVIYRW